MRVETRESALGRGSLPNSEGNAANRNPHALSMTNAPEMSFWTFSDSFPREMHPKCANSRFGSHFRPKTYQKKADLEHFDTFLAHSGRKCIGSEAATWRRRIGEWT